MSANQKDFALPAYEHLPPSEAATQIFLGRIHITVNAEYDHVSHDPTETKRLRNFMLYCLAVDYRVPCPLSISRSDRRHYLELCAAIWDMRTIGRTVNDLHLTAEDRRTLAPYFWKYLHAPCIRLGIPVESAVQVVLRYGKFLALTGRYKGCVHGVLHSYGVPYLARKLTLDRSILIPHLVRSEELRLKLNESLDEVARAYFTSIEDEGYRIVCSSNPDTGLREEHDPGYTLTARGKQYEVNRKHTLYETQRWIRPYAAVVLVHLAKLANRVKGFFPKSSREAMCDDTCMGPIPASGVATKEHSMWNEPPHSRDHVSIGVPDLFEHRPGQGRCDS